MDEQRGRTLDYLAVISVFIPTTGRRAELLDRCASAYRDEHGDNIEILTIEGHTWGKGLNLLTAKAQGEWWLWICDDTLPHPGWFDAARPMVEEGFCPASRYFNEDGSPLHEADTAAHGAPVVWCRSFLMTPARFADVGPMIDATWYADIDYSERLRAHGYEIVGCDGFAFTHLNGERDWQTEGVVAEEEQRYLESHARIESGLAW